jgi:protein ImuB
MYAVLLLSNFRLQAALRFRPELLAGRGASGRTGGTPGTLALRPIAMTDESDAKARLLEVNEAAARLGVEPGQTSSQALARCGALTLLPRSGAQEISAQAALLEIAGTLSPEVEDTAPGYVTANLQGTRDPDWQALAARAVAALAELRLAAWIGVGKNPDLAFLAARQARPVLVVQTPTAFLANLAIHELEPSPEMLVILREWGVHNLGQLTSLPRGALMDRLGPDAARLWERAAGRTGRPLRPVRAAEEFCETYEFEHEIDTVEPLLFLLRRFLEQLTLRLGHTYRVAGRMTLTLRLANEQSYERIFTVPSPTADVEILFRILHTHLDGLRLEHRAIAISLRIDATLAERQQFQLFESPLRDPNRFGETLGRLAALVGDGNVGSPILEDTHRPDSFRLEPPRFHELARMATLPEDLTVGLPLRRYRPALTATVQVRHHIPAFLHSPRASGPIECALGPFRISGNWWDAEAWAVEEWDIELASGCLYRIARHGDDWRIEGSYNEPTSSSHSSRQTIVPMSPA